MLARKLITVVLTALPLSACVVPAPEPTAPEAAEEAVEVELPRSEGLHDLNGTEIYVKRLGSGEPVLVIHGGPVLEHGYLLPHLEPLADGYELVLADQRVSGRSAAEVPAESVRVESFVADIEALRRELGLGRVHLMAHSWGGLLALSYALEHEAALRSLTLISPMSGSSELWQREQQAQGALADPADQEARQGILASEAFAAQEPAAIEALLRLAFKGQFHDPARVADLELYVPEDYMARSRLFGSIMTDIAEYDLHPRLTALTTPTLILYGADEPGASLGGAALRAAIPGSSLVTLEDSGHFSFIEQPDAFLQQVGDFLAAND